MLNLLSKYRDLVAVVVCLLVPAVVLYAQTRSDADAGPAVRAVLRLTAPIQDGMTSVVESVSDRWTAYIQTADSLKENRAMRIELSRLRRTEERLGELERENERLRALLHARPTPGPGEVMAARVIAVGASNVYRTVRVDVGRDDGVRRGMAVVNENGAVGSVLRTSGGYSDVLLVSDRQSAVDVTLPRTGARGLAHGTAGEGEAMLRVEGLERSDDVKIGDEVVASGLGARFPRGVKVGTVVAVERPENSFYQTATVQPAVNFRKLSHVLVVRTVEEPLYLVPPTVAPPPVEVPTQGDAGVSDEQLTELVESPPAWVLVPQTDGGVEEKRAPAGMRTPDDVGGSAVDAGRRRRRDGGAVPPGGPDGGTVARPAGVRDGGGASAKGTAARPDGGGA
ncbi:MAG: rod shape-determining protein MreC [Myxococcota bacterium]